MKRFLLAILLFTLGLSFPARAQFVVPGDDPACLRWYSLESPFYNIIYPEGADSLARSYARLLEQFRRPMGASIGFTPGEGLRKKMPIVLHTRHVYSNGSVAWAPRRFDLFTLPQAYGSEPTPWDIQLASHEPRHQAQLQAWSRSYGRPLNWLIGQGWNPVGWQVYIGRTFGEGDAVVAETGLWKGNRARTADFLDYYRMAFDQGDFRNWSGWRYDSFKHYVPDVYALGYLTLAGGRYFYNRPSLLAESVASALKNPFRLAPWNVQHHIARAGGKESFKTAFRDLQERYDSLWRAEAALRGPSTPLERLSGEEAFPVFYDSPVAVGDGFYLLRSGYAHARELVRWQDGRMQPVRPFAHHASRLSPDPVRGRLYWSETVQDKRWDLAGASVVRYYDLASGKVRDLSQKGRLYNPQPSPDGRCVAAVDYPAEGGSAVVLLSADDGRELQRIPAPGPLQLTETAWLGASLYALGITREGFGLYRAQEDGSWAEALAPSLQKVHSLRSAGDRLEWVSDRDGSNQLYAYDPAAGRLTQLTSARYGIKDACWLDGRLYAVSQALDGRPFFRAEPASLRDSAVCYADVHAWQVEDALMEQEKALAGALPDLLAEVPLSRPKRYYKALHPLHFHTWAPLYLNYDAVTGGSFDLSYESLSLGATAFFQNDLGSLSGTVGYGFHQDPDDETRWRHSLHGKLTYTGWYPVLEASVDLGDRDVTQYNLAWLRGAEGTKLAHLTSSVDAPLVTGSLRAYIPFIFNRGGWLRGVTPQLSYAVSNNRYETTPFILDEPVHFKEFPSHYYLTGIGSGGGNYLMQLVSASVRGYVMLARAHSQVYPRLGLGLEAGFSLRPGITDVFAPVAYAYAYGYLPGFVREQGLRLTTTLQHQLRSGAQMFGEMRTTTLPRGFQASASSAAAQAFPTQWRVTADYGIPIYVGDLSLRPVMYISHFLLTPHADFTLLSGAWNLWSAGADLTAELRRILVLDFDTSVGVSFSWLGGSWMEASGQTKPYHVGLVYNMSF